MASSNPLAYYLIPISAPTKAELDSKVSQLSHLLESGEESLAVISAAVTLGHNAAGHLHRMFVGGATKEDILTQLRSNSFKSAQAPGTPPKLAFLLAGYGVASGLGEHIYKSFPIITKTLAETDFGKVRLKSGKRLMDLIYSKEEEDQEPKDEDERDEVAMIMKPSYQINIIADYFNTLIQPDVVLGHSIGEYMSANIAGIISKNEGIALSNLWVQHAHRAEEGRMAVVFCPEETVDQMIDAFKKSDYAEEASEFIELTARNTPAQCVVGGTPKAMEWMGKWCRENDVFTVGLPLNAAFHTRFMDYYLPELSALAKTLEYKTPVKTYISSSTGKVMDKMDETYWTQHFRRPVDYVNACRTLADQDVEVIIELGVGTTLFSMFQSNVPDEALRKIKYFPIMKKNEKDISYFMDLLGQLHVLGLNLNWPHLYDCLNIPAPKQPIHLKSGGNFQKLPSEAAKKPFLHSRISAEMESVLKLKDVTMG